ncbi:MAG: hypothetical protein ACI94D_000212 [Neolewinella sp.]|jgi:hypothetical protein
MICIISASLSMSLTEVSPSLKSSVSAAGVSVSVVSEIEVGSLPLLTKNKNSRMRKNRLETFFIWDVFSETNPA